MSIFDRMARIAKAEFNDLKRRISGDDDDDDSVKPDGKAKARSGETVEIDDEGSASASKSEGDTVGEASWPAQKWPREVREGYAALELPLGADEDEVGKAYRSLLKRYHPDKHATDPESEKAAAELVKALGNHKDVVLDHLARMKG